MAQIRYPYLRKRKLGAKVIRIEVMADSLRVGKTTAVKVIANGLRQKGFQVTDSYEDWQNNPHLKAAYDDPRKNFLNSQKWFVRRKWEQIRDGGDGIFVQDVSPEMDYCYAVTNWKLGRITDQQFEEYDEYFRSLDWTIAPAPDVLIHLSVSDEGLLQRAMDSRREFETVEPEYFLMMKKINREWLGGVTADYRVIEVETDNLDFAHNVEASEELVGRIKRLLT